MRRQYGERLKSTPRSAERAISTHHGSYDAKIPDNEPCKTHTVQVTWTV